MILEADSREIDKFLGYVGPDIAPELKANAWPEALLNFISPYFLNRLYPEGVFTVTVQPTRILAIDSPTDYYATLSRHPSSLYPDIEMRYDLFNMSINLPVELTFSSNKPEEPIFNVNIWISGEGSCIIDRIPLPDDESQLNDMILASILGLRKHLDNLQRNTTGFETNYSQ